MNFLDKLVLPQSLEHTTLLHFLLMVVLFMFIPFLSMVLGGSILSLYYRKKAKSRGNLHFERFSKEIIELVTVNKSTGLALGLAPYLMLIMAYTQILHTLDLQAIVFFSISFVFAVVGFVLLYTYRYSSYFSGLLHSIQANPDSQVADYSVKVNRLYERSGRWGLFFIIIAVFFLAAGFVFALQAATAVVPASFWDAFTNIAVYTQWLYLMLSAITFAASFIVFNYFYWNGGRNLDGEYTEFIKQNILKSLIIFLLAQPVLLMINVNLIPATALSMTVFAMPVLGIAFIFITLHLVYQMIKFSNVHYSGYLFVLLYLVSFVLIIGDQTAMSTATNKNALILASKFEVFKKGLAKSETSGAVSGEEIFKTKCSACHRFDTKLVGPPYKETLPKYAGNAAKLAEYVKNPVKVNPAYPPMPNQGLKPAEARAIAKYILEEVKKY